MNTLMLSPETNNNQKQKQRLLYERRAVSQDHGTKGTTNQADSWDRGGKQRQLQALGNLELVEAWTEVSALKSPAQLEKAADAILRASGFEVANEYDLLDADIREQLEIDTPGFQEVTEFDNDDTAAYLENQALLRQEINGMFERGSAVKANADYIATGSLDPTDEALLPDYVSGLHITDRP